MRTSEIIKNLAEMQYDWDLHYLLSQTRSSVKEIHFYWEPGFIQWTIPIVLYQYHYSTLTLNSLMTQMG